MKIVDKESKTNLPRWFNGVSIILKICGVVLLRLYYPIIGTLFIKGLKKVQKV